MKHAGGPCPVDPETMVIVRYNNGLCAGASQRDGIKAAPIMAKERKWDWRSKTKRYPDDFDIVAYWLAEWVPEEQRVAA